MHEHGWIEKTIEELKSRNDQLKYKFASDSTTDDLIERFKNDVKIEALEWVLEIRENPWVTESNM